MDRAYDIVIVGGGTAGCVLAARLSALSHLRILLLEAGGNRNDDPKVQAPLTSRQMFGDANYDWNLETIPQVHLDNRVIQQTRGRMLGGSSAINSHSLVYPNKEMHDVWARIIGDDRWSWEQMQGCYLRFSGETKDFKGAFGPKSDIHISASYPKQANQLQEAWEAVFETLDMRSRNDGASGQCFGGFTTTNAIDDRPGKGDRSHAGTAYLQPILGRKNLTVETEARSTKLLLRKSNDGTSSLTVIGVEYEKNGQKMSVNVRREAILAAGVFGSPQILELSGIGSRKVLRSVDIECLVELPGVGENLQEHLNFGPSVEVNADIETMDAATRDPVLMAEQRKLYLETRTGLIAEGAAYSFAFWPLQLFNTSNEEAELKSLLESHPTSSRNESRAQHQDFIRRMILQPNEASATVFMTRIQRHTTPVDRADGNYMTVVAMLSHPFSSGSTHITSQDPNAKPRIDCGYLSHPLDAEILARHSIQIERLLNQPIYHSIIKPDGRRLPREFAQPFTDTADAKAAIRKYGATNYHPCGTCAMIPRADGGVVDSDLKVYGTTNLRICDASIFPIIPRGNILTTVYAVAEKAAEFLIKENSISHASSAI